MLLPLLYACGGDVIRHTDETGDSAVNTVVQVSALEPDHGPSTGGTLVHVRGAGFTTAGTVTVGGAPCAELTFLGSTELYCTTPAGTAGTVTLEVVEAEGTGAASFTYDPPGGDTGDTGEAPAEITACALDGPSTLAAYEDQPSAAVLGSVTIPGRTDYDGSPVGVEAEVGFGARGADPSEWTWRDAAWSAQAGEADQYSGALTFDLSGTYDYSYRFRVDHGAWSVCTDSAGAYGAAEVAEDPGTVDYCHLQWPCSTTVAAGGTSEGIYAWVYEYEVTQGSGQGGGIELELGVGPDGGDPEVGTGWVWSPMSYYADKDGLSAGDQANDEYRGTFVAPATSGSYDYVARASLDGGSTWILCDQGGDSCNLGGSSDGYDDPGTCTVE